MLHRYTASTTLFLLAGLLLAQPTIDPSNNTPLLDADYTVDLGLYMLPGNAGAGQGYGYWMLESTGDRNYRHHAPSVTPTSALYPTATRLFTDGGSDTLFHKVDANGIELVGERTALAASIPYSNGALELKYPCTYGTTWSDIFQANYSVSGFPVARVGTITGNADGWGTLELPEVTFNNVLRVHVRKATQDQSAVINVDRVTHTHYFFTDQVPFPVLKLQVDTSVISGGNPAVSSIAEWMFGPGQVGIAELDPTDVVFTPYPNPADGAVNLSFGTGHDKVRFLEVLDGTGRLVAQRDLGQAPSGDLLGAFHAGGLSPGVYHIRLSGADGVMGTRRLVVR